MHKIVTFMNISAALLADSACFIAASFSACYAINQLIIWVMGSLIEEGVLPWKVLHIICRCALWTSCVGMPTNVLVDSNIPLVLTPNMVVDKCSGQQCTHSFDTKYGGGQMFWATMFR